MTHDNKPIEFCPVCDGAGHHKTPIPCPDKRSGCAVFHFKKETCASCGGSGNAAEKIARSYYEGAQYLGDA